MRSGEPGNLCAKSVTHVGEQSVTYVTDCTRGYKEPRSAFNSLCVLCVSVVNLTGASPVNNFDLEGLEFPAAVDLRIFVVDRQCFVRNFLNRIGGKERRIENELPHIRAE